MTEAPEALRLFFDLVQRQAGAEGAVHVLEDRAAIRQARKTKRPLREFVRLPSTGGAFVLAGTESARAFTLGLEGLTLSRPVWRLARRVLGALSPLGVHRLLGLPELAVFAGGAEERGYSIQAGVPGGGQKLIVREWGGAAPEAFWKLGPRGLPAQLVEAESRALEWLESHLADAQLTPKLLGSGVDADVSWLKMSAMGGVRPGNKMTAATEGFLSALATAKEQARPLGASSWLAGIELRLSEIEAGAPELVSACRVALDAVQVELGKTPIEFWPSHGDFTPWNARLEAGSLRAFDWEFFDASRPALFDWLHWIVQTGVLVLHHEVSQLLPQLMAPTRLLPGATGSLRAALLQLYLVDVLSREEAIMQHERPEFVQVEWLRSTRLGLLERSAA